MQSGRDHNNNFDTAADLGYPRSREASSKTYVAILKVRELEKRRPAKYPGRDIKIDPNNQGFRT